MRMPSWFANSGRDWAAEVVPLSSFLLFGFIILSSISCELGLEGGAAEAILGDESGLGTTGERIGRLDAASILGRAEMEEALAARQTLSELLENAAREGSQTLSIQESGAIYREGRRVGFIGHSGEIDLVSRSGERVFAGRLFDGKLWGADISGNIRPVASLRGVSRANGLVLRSGPSAEYPVLEVLQGPATADVVKFQNGWFELDFSGRKTAWVPEAAAAISLVAVPIESVRRLGAVACAVYMQRASPTREKHKTTSGQGGGAATIFANARASELSMVTERDHAWRAVLAGKTVVLRHTISSSALAGRVAGRLEQLGAMVEHQGVDSSSSSVCAGDIYYQFTLLDEAQAIRSTIGDMVELRTTSTDGPKTVVVWIP